MRIREKKNLETEKILENSEFLVSPPAGEASFHLLLPPWLLKIIAPGWEERSKGRKDGRASFPTGKAVVVKSTAMIAREEDRYGHYPEEGE